MTGEGFNFSLGNDIYAIKLVNCEYTENHLIVHYFCVYGHVCVCRYTMHAHMSVCVYMCRLEGNFICQSSGASPTPFLGVGQGLSLFWNLPNRLGWLASVSQDPSASVSPALKLQVCAIPPDIFMWV